MKTMKRILALVASLAVILSLNIPAFAADGYQYNVTISAGTKGTIAGGESVTVTKGYGAAVDLNSYISSVAPVDGYVCTGFHEAGIEGVVASATVTKDVTYVATYSKKGNRAEVSYTVKYVDAATGKEIADPYTGTGLPGDEAVVPFKVIDNYMPTGYNLRFVIEAGQTYEYKYNDISASTIIRTITVEGETRYVYVTEEEQQQNQGQGQGGQTPGQGGQTQGQTGTGTAEGQTPAQGGSTEQAGQAGTGEGQGQGQAEAGTTPQGSGSESGSQGSTSENPQGTTPSSSDQPSEEPPLPEEVVEITPEPVPLAGNTTNVVPIVAGTIGGIIVLIAIIAVALNVKRKRK